METDSTTQIELRELRELYACVLEMVDTHKAMAAVDTMAAVLASDLGITPGDDLALINHVLHARLRELMAEAKNSLHAMLPMIDVPF